MLFLYCFCTVFVSFYAVFVLNNDLICKARMRHAADVAAAREKEAAAEAAADAADAAALAAEEAAGRAVQPPAITIRSAGLDLRGAYDHARAAEDSGAESDASMIGLRIGKPAAQVSHFLIYQSLACFTDPHNPYCCAGPR